MTTISKIYTQLQFLPESQLQKVADYVLSLNILKENAFPNAKKKREFGGHKGIFTMSDDFDEPLDDFKDYM